MSDRHREFCKRQHQVFAHFLAVQAFRARVEAIAVERSDWLAFFGVKNWKKVRERWFIDDVKPWFSHFHGLVYLRGRSVSKRATIYLSNVPLNLPGGLMNTMERLAKVSPIDPLIGLVQGLPEDERVMLSYLSLLAVGIEPPPIEKFLIHVEQRPKVNTILLDMAMLKSLPVKVLFWKEFSSGSEWYQKRLCEATLSALGAAGINTVGELVSCTEHKIAKVLLAGFVKPSAVVNIPDPCCDMNFMKTKMHPAGLEFRQFAAKEIAESVICKGVARIPFAQLIDTLASVKAVGTALQLRNVELKTLVEWTEEDGLFHGWLVRQDKKIIAFHATESSAMECKAKSAPQDSITIEDLSKEADTLTRAFGILVVKGFSQKDYFGSGKITILEKASDLDYPIPSLEWLYDRYSESLPKASQGTALKIENVLALAQ